MRTPRERAVEKAEVLERVALAHGTRRTVASSLVAHLPRYGVPLRERPKNILRAFVWEMTGEHEQLVRLVTACYRALPEPQTEGSEELRQPY
jgi:hypothetical protein